MSIEKLENWSPRASIAAEPLALGRPLPVGDARSLLFGGGSAELRPPGETPAEGVAGVEVVAAETVGCEPGAKAGHSPARAGVWERGARSSGAEEADS